MSALATHDLLVRNGIAPCWRYRAGDPYVQKCRNVLASEFMTEHTDSDTLFFIDDDVGWEPEAALRIILREEDVIAGIYPKKQDYPLEFPVQMHYNADGTANERDGMYEADLVPTGFLRVKRKVMEAAQRDSGEYPEIDRLKGTLRCWDFFRTGFVPTEPNGRVGRWWGEDFFFSVMVRNLGFSIWVDPNIRFTHTGAKAWEATFADSIRREPTRIQQG